MLRQSKRFSKIDPLCLTGTDAQLDSAILRGRRREYQTSGHRLSGRVTENEVIRRGLGRQPPDSFYATGGINRGSGVVGVEVEVEGLTFAVDHGSGKEISRIETAEPERYRTE